MTADVEADSDWPDLRELDTVAPVIGKVLPPPPPTTAAAVGFRQSALSVDSAFFGPFHVAGCSMVGAGHLASGTPRQDAYDVALTSGGRLVVAIADGMGSRAESQVGARSFCEAVVRQAAAMPDASCQEYLGAGASDAAALAASAYGLSVDDASFVAAVAVATRDGVEVARVGDVSAFSLDAAGTFVELFDDDGDGGHVNVVKDCLPSETQPTPELVVSSTERTLVLATDGLANDLRMSEGLRAWLAECWQAPSGPYRMADALRYRRRGSHDDRTAVVVSFARADGVPNDDVETEEDGGER